ncbi:hypothetical protein IWW40_005875 [Coemansia sp. RSA 1250]|nr:hypothetical protein IWW40_005875 [Coemansia sp. RSA 1250]
MSEAEPRRFMIGLGVAKNGSVRVYIYTPGRVYSTPLGNMPLLNEVKLSNNALRVIQFLLLLHTQLQKDSGGLELTDAEIVDAFAGYAHTLIAAATMDTDTNFVLHRDVSTGNLMISNDKMPYVIDWGYGRICAENEVPSYSDKKMIGAAVYMSIRVLKQCWKRSVIDDLESLFLLQDAAFYDEVFR